MDKLCTNACAPQQERGALLFKEAYLLQIQMLDNNKSKRKITENNTTILCIFYKKES